MGLRNPLLNFRPSPVRGVAVVGAPAVAVYEVLVRQGKTMHFQPAAVTAAAAETDAAAETPIATVQHPPPKAHPDSRLPTHEPPAQLERRLLNTYYTARTSLEEQGVNILYLALGMLTWYEDARSPEPRQAPLLLVPVVLERGRAAERFGLRYTGAEVAGNLSLQARLKASFGLVLPLPDADDAEQLDLPAYLAAVQAAVAGMPRWHVAADSITLGFFSFAKLLLYRDLDPANWPAAATLLGHPALEALLGAGPGFQDAAPTAGDEAFLDTDTPAAELHQVLDADSSQLLALLAVHEGRNLIIQGPPGTGKSQTIANLLAEAIGAGKTVLFVAEKMAALEVVKRRLDALGLGAACLELHSHKANKKAVLAELRHTLGLGRPTPAARAADQAALLPHYGQALNDYARAVNAPLAGSRRSAQQVAGELLALREDCGTMELPRLPFHDMGNWTDADAAHAEALAARLQATLHKTGVPQQLPFWGSELTVLLPAQKQLLPGLLHEARKAGAQLQATAEALAQAFTLPRPADRAAAEALLPTARHAALAPPLAGLTVAGPWVAEAARLAEIVQAGIAWNSLQQRFAPLLLPEAWAADLQPERATLLAVGDKWWKPLSSDYRRARLRLQSVWRTPLPTENGPLVAAIEAIHEAARLARTLAEAGPVMAQLFGAGWQGRRSDWPSLRRQADYLILTHQRIARRELPPELLEFLMELASNSVHFRALDNQSLASGQGPKPGETPVLPGPPGAGTSEAEPGPTGVGPLETALANHRAALLSLVEALQLNEVRRFGPEGRLQFQPFAAQQAILADWAAGLAALPATVEWNNAAAAVRAEQRAELLPLAESWADARHWLAAAVRQTWLEFLQKTAFDTSPALRRFERAGHEELAGHFGEVDRATLLHNRIRAMQRHFADLPTLPAPGQMLVISHELAKKTRHLPLRQLMQEAGRAVQAIKPVFMMSPLSIAGYLPPGAVEFDLVVFDEASQVRPMDALGAIARGRQLVVVGDSQQLPPTSFFETLTHPDEADEENRTIDIQSILELCRARQMPERLLRWHYRSRHDSLIAPSNHLFYDDRLVVFPSPGGQPGLGLKYHHLPEAHYERGTTRTNPAEAAAVAAAVLHHTRRCPQLTLGVVAFSMAQRAAIEAAVETGRRQHPETEAFFNRHPHEPFFIKNLENVQGDERDFILISIGYGRSREGSLPMSFGPLNGDGGERRLNVLITRARLRCEVFTNLTADDLDLRRTSARGVAALKSFLYYAQHRRLNPYEDSSRPPESPFEDVVARALTARGYQLRPRVGSPGFYLDLAVIDPDQPDRYVLGIVCDGAIYHAARSARDRDRLRRQVLEASGWRLHPIWSIDWFRNPAAAAARAVAAIEEAIAATRRHPNRPGFVESDDLAASEIPETITAAEARTTGAAAGASRISEEAKAIGAPVASADHNGPLPGLPREAAAGPRATLPYQLAQLPRTITQKALHQHPTGRLAAWVAEVVAVESPVHADEVTRRLALASGSTQVGRRMRASVAAAIRLAGQMGSIRPQGDFLWTPVMPATAAPVRDRSALPAASRKLALVAPEELAAAVRAVVRASFSVPRAAVLLPAARLLGFARPGEEQRAQLAATVEQLLNAGILQEVNGSVRIA